MKSMKLLRPAFMCFAPMMLLHGALYTVVITGVAQFLFPSQVNSSIIIVTLKDGAKKEYGFKLIAQEFTRPEYLIGRPVGVTNLSPTGEEQKKLVEKRIDWQHSLDPGSAADTPMDSMTASASGMDPNISPAAAEYQAARIAAARNVSVEEARRIIQTYTNGPSLGVIGEPTVNILKVNLALDGLLSS